MDQNLVQTMKIRQICEFLDSVASDRKTFMKLMKFTKQSPTVYEDNNEYETIFKDINETLTKYKEYDFLSRLNRIATKQRENAFVALCKHGSNVNKMTFSNCNLFKRSFTNKGIGFTFNNAKVDDLLKKSFGQQDATKVLALNENEKIKKMVSAGSDHALRVLLDYNEEAVQRYAITIDGASKHSILTIIYLEIVGSC